MNPATPAGIANADAHLKDVGLPTYSELAGALRDLMNYTGGWDEKPSHPCGKAARVISRLEAAGKFLYQDPTAQDDTPTIDLMHVSYDRILLLSWRDCGLDNGAIPLATSGLPQPSFDRRKSVVAEMLRAAERLEKPFVGR